MCWTGGSKNAAQCWRAHRREPGPSPTSPTPGASTALPRSIELSANASASVLAWCVPTDPVEPVTTSATDRSRSTLHRSHRDRRASGDVLDFQPVGGDDGGFHEGPPRVV